MTMMTAATIAAKVTEDFRDAKPHGHGCWCCQQADGDNPDLDVKLGQEAEYVVSRFRPGEGYLSDETDESLDELCDRMAAEGRRAVESTYTRILSEYLAGKVAVA